MSTGDRPQAVASRDMAGARPQDMAHPDMAGARPQDTARRDTAGESTQRDPTTLVLVRHAAPELDQRAYVYGTLDLELSEAGHAHARELGETLASTAFTALYSSPLRRATATAAPLAELLGLDVVTVPDLREITFGELEGLTLVDIEARYPEALKWTVSPSVATFPGGDSVREFRARAVAAARELVARHPGETVAIFSHAVTIRAILADALGMEEDALFRLHQAYGGISVIDWFGELPLVRAVNAARI
jgi:broad specificity phosphatase PhoE